MWVSLADSYVDLFKILLATNVVWLISTFFSSFLSSSIIILWCIRWTSLVYSDLRMMAHSWIFPSLETRPPGVWFWLVWINSKWQICWCRCEDMFHSVWYFLQIEGWIPRIGCPGMGWRLRWWMRRLCTSAQLRGYFPKHPSFLWEYCVPRD